MRRGAGRRRRRGGCWRSRWCWKASTGRARRRPAGWIGRRCGTGYTATMRRGSPGWRSARGEARPRRLDPSHVAELVSWLEAGPLPVVDGVVRWRRQDLRARIWRTGSGSSCTSGPQGQSSDAAGALTAAGSRAPAREDPPTRPRNALKKFPRGGTRRAPRGGPRQAAGDLVRATRARSASRARSPGSGRSGGTRRCAPRDTRYQRCLVLRERPHPLCGRRHHA